MTEALIDVVRALYSINTTHEINNFIANAERNPSLCIAANIFLKENKKEQLKVFVSKVSEVVDREQMKFQNHFYQEMIQAHLPGEISNFQMELVEYITEPDPYTAIIKVISNRYEIVFYC